MHKAKNKHDRNIPINRKSLAQKIHCKLPDNCCLPPQPRTTALHFNAWVPDGRNRHRWRSISYGPAGYLRRLMGQDKYGVCVCLVFSMRSKYVQCISYSVGIIPLVLLILGIGFFLRKPSALGIFATRGSILDGQQSAIVCVLWNHLRCGFDENDGINNKRCNRDSDDYANQPFMQFHTSWQWIDWFNNGFMTLLL